jgi:ribosomal protein S18 acetylase RimI-like enzyme
MVRPGHLADLPSVYEICHVTGLNGGDATGAVTNRQLLGHYFAAPYLVRDPSWCWMAADDEGVAGYLVTTPDTRAFAAWMDADWLPAVRSLLPARDNPAWPPTETWIRNVIQAPFPVPDLAAEYPAHLHIDFLPRAQGQGWGPRVLEAFRAKLRAEGVRGFHLGVATANEKAHRFYARQGFRVIREPPGVIYYGLKAD